jgi:hypothetical protein
MIFRITRRRVIAALVLVAVVAGAFVGGRASVVRSTKVVHTVGAPSRPTTTVEVITPWTVDGTISKNLSVTSATGYCWTGSLAVNDSQAWRCMAGNDIFDPCFAPVAEPEGSPEVACMATPWGGVVRLRLTKALPYALGDSGSGAANPDWAIELANHDRCVVSTGANGELGGIALVYYCQSGASAGSLDTKSEPWTIEYLRKDGDVFQQVDIRLAWAG